MKANIVRQLSNLITEADPDGAGNLCQSGTDTMKGLLSTRKVNCKECPELNEAYGESHGKADQWGVRERASLFWYDGLI